MVVRIWSAQPVFDLFFQPPLSQHRSNMAATSMTIDLIWICCWWLCRSAFPGDTEAVVSSFDFDFTQFSFCKFKGSVPVKDSPHTIQYDLTWSCFYDVVEVYQFKQTAKTNVLGWKKKAQLNLESFNINSSMRKLNLLTCCTRYGFLSFSFQKLIFFSYLLTIMTMESLMCSQTKVSRHSNSSFSSSRVDRDLF